MYAVLAPNMELVHMVPLSISFQGKPLDILHRRPMFQEMFKKGRPVRKDVYICGRQIGKFLSLDTPIPTPEGWTTMGEIKEGDVIFSEDGTPSKVTQATPVMYGKDCYELEFDNGEKIVAGGEHLWKVSRSSNPRSRHGKPRIVNTLELIGLMPKSKKGPRYSIVATDPILCPDKDLPIDPYVLGVWLGDGTSRNGQITSCVTDVDEMMANIKASGYETGDILRSKDPSRENTVNFNVVGLNTQLKDGELRCDKHIPEAYFRSSFEQRLSLLRGLMDTDGCVRKNGGCEITQKNKDICIGVRELLATLGVKSRLNKKTVRIKGKNPRDEVYWTVEFATMLPVFRLSRKAERHSIETKGHPRNKRHYIHSITKVDSVPVRCIAVDHPSHMYLCGRTMIPTHNTVSISSSILMHCWWRNYFRMMYVAPMSIYTQRLHSMFMQPMIQGKMLPWEIVDRDCICNVNEKSFVGGSRYVGISCFGNASNSLGISVDWILGDEIQDLNLDFIPQIREVVGTSDYRYESYFGTARGVDNTLTTIYEGSTQNIWKMPCPKCKHENYPTMHGNVLDMIQKEGICCVKCKGLLDVDRGSWQRTFEYDPISRDMEGYHVPQIIVKDRLTPHSRYIDTIYNKLHGSMAYSEAKFLQEVLGIPTSQGGVPLTQQDIKAVSTLEIPQDGSGWDMDQYHNVTGGVDWGGAEIVSFTVGALVGYRDGKFDCFAALRPTGLPDESRHYVVGDFLKRASRYKVRLVGADAGFVGSVQNPNLEAYMGVQVGSIAYGTTRKFFVPQTNNCFTVDRTTLIYIVISLIKMKKIRFPKDPWFDQYTRDLLAIYTEDSVNSHGITVRRYCRYKDRPDDFLHALGYAIFMCALGMVDLPAMAGMPSDSSLNAPYIKDIGEEMGRFGG